MWFVFVYSPVRWTSVAFLQAWGRRRKGREGESGIERESKRERESSRD